jgi:urease accessory protein
VRHAPLQIREGELRYLHDPVLDDLLRRMGLEVSVEQAPFEPEPGAYAHGGHSHGT